MQIYPPSLCHQSYLSLAPSPPHAQRGSSSCAKKTNHPLHGSELARPKAAPCSIQRAVTFRHTFLFGLLVESVRIFFPMIGSPKYDVAVLSSLPSYPWRRGARQINGAMPGFPFWPQEEGWRGKTVQEVSGYINNTFHGGTTIFFLSS